MTTYLHKQFQRETHHHHQNLNEVLFWGFVGTLLQSVIPRNDIYVDIFPFADRQIMIASVIWIAGINFYLAILFETIYKLTSEIGYHLIAGLYCFAVLEFFLMYDKAWFYVWAVPIYSDTFIAIVFFYIFLKRWY